VQKLIFIVHSYLSQCKSNWFDRKSFFLECIHIKHEVRGVGSSAKAFILECIQNNHGARLVGSSSKANFGVHSYQSWSASSCFECKNLFLECIHTNHRVRVVGSSAKAYFWSAFI